MLGPSAGHALVYLDGSDLERDCGALMRFRLTYNGPLKSTQPAHINDQRGMYTDKRAEHKHDIRRQFHKQLKHLWETNNFLRDARLDPRNLMFGEVLPPSAENVDWNIVPNRGPEELKRYGMPMVDLLAECYRHPDHNYRFVPLVRQEISLACSLRVLFLRRDFPAPVLSAGDIDNRLKTLIDALRMPQMREGIPDPPVDGEKPFFVLLDDDRQITHLEVETDIALAESETMPRDNSFARLVVTVEVRPYNANLFNLGFA